MDSVDGLDPADGLLFSSIYAVERAGEFCDCAPDSAGADGLRGKFDVWGMAAGRVSFIQPCGVVLHEMHHRLEPMVGGLAARIDQYGGTVGHHAGLVLFGCIDGHQRVDFSDKV